MPSNLSQKEIQVINQWLVETQQIYPAYQLPTLDQFLNFDNAKCDVFMRNTSACLELIKNANISLNQFFELDHKISKLLIFNIDKANCLLKQMCLEELTQSFETCDQFLTHYEKIMHLFRYGITPSQLTQMEWHKREHIIHDYKSIAELLESGLKLETIEKLSYNLYTECINHIEGLIPLLKMGVTLPQWFDLDFNVRTECVQHSSTLVELLSAGIPFGEWVELPLDVREECIEKSERLIQY